MDATRLLATIDDQKGMALVYVALCIFVLCGFLGMVVDLGHMQVVRGELQNAADAAALAGAGRLYAAPASPGSPPTLDWNAATSAAAAFISENKSDNAALADGTVEVGYWNLLWDPATNPPLTPITTAPGSLTSDDIAAVKVTISRSGESNGGPVDTFFMKVLGVDNAPVGSRPAVAVIGFPASMPSNSLFPMVLSRCMTDQYFSQVPLPIPPTQIRISSLYTPGGDDCYSGQWTSFQEDSNAASVINGLIANGNPTPLNIGDNTWIATGEMNSLYNNVTVNKDVLMAIVQDVIPGTEKPILGFATFHIDVAQNGNAPYIEGHFIAYDTTPPSSTPGGAISNTLTLPMMVK